MIASARKGYESPLSEGEILAKAGYKNGDALKADYDTLLRLLQGAFSSLLEKAEKVGSRNYAGYFEQGAEARSDDPKGKAAFSWLESYGLWGEASYKGSEQITTQTTRTLLQRIFAYLGASPEEDYYTYANADRLFDSSVKVGSGELYYAQKIVDESNINDFYVSFLNQDSPALYADFAKGVGLGGLKGYADKIRSATTSNFWDVLSEVSSSSGSYLFALNAFFQAKDDTSKIRISLSDADALKALKKLIDKPSSLQKLFASFGYDSSLSSSLSEDFASYFEAIEDQLPEIDPSSISEGLSSYIRKQVGEEFTYSFSGGNLMKTVTYLGHGLDESSLPKAKAYALAMLAYNYRALLDKDTREELGFSSEKGDKADFLSLTSKALQCYFVNAYSSSEKGKKSYAKVNELGKEAISLIQSRLPENNWLSQAGQKAISNKLGKINFVVGATCQEHLSFNLSMDTSSLEKALGTGMFSYWKNIREDSKEIEDPDMLSFFYDDVLMPNAMYDLENSTVDITLGILTSYGDDLISLSDEDLYGSFLTAITHEITHSIDSKGIYYDEDGKAISESILSESDIAAYNEKQSKVKALHTYETLPGILQEANTTLPEDIADLSGMTISEKIYEKNAKSIDWKSYYKSIARHLYSVCSYTSWKALYHEDVHSFGKARVNSLFANSANFASVYGVKELNGMYVSPSDRVIVW